MEAVKQAIMHTPSWVWPLLALLLWLGVAAMRTRSIRLVRLIVLPAVFFALSVFSMLSSPLPLVEALGIWLAGLALGSLIGRLIAPRHGVIIDRARHRLTVPGSIVPLILIVVIFIGRYASGYAFARYPELRQDTFAVILAASYAALCTGIMLGRTLPLLAAYFRAVPLDGGKAP